MACEGKKSAGARPPPPFLRLCAWAPWAPHGRYGAHGSPRHPLEQLYGARDPPKRLCGHPRAHPANWNINKLRNYYGPPHNQLLMKVSAVVLGTDWTRSHNHDSAWLALIQLHWLQCWHSCSDAMVFRMVWPNL